MRGIPVLEEASPSGTTSFWLWYMWRWITDLVNLVLNNFEAPQQLDTDQGSEFLKQFDAGTPDSEQSEVESDQDPIPSSGR